MQKHQLAQVVILLACGIGIGFTLRTIARGNAPVDGANAELSSDIAVATCVTEISEKEPARAMDMAATIEDSTLRAEALAHVATRFISKEEGGTKAFDVRKWMRENPKIGEELRAANTRD